MAMNSIHAEATELLLSAIFRTPADNSYSHSFFYGPPGTVPFFGNAVARIFYRRDHLMRAVMYVRSHGSPHLRYVSIETVRTTLQNFIKENFWHINHGVVFSDPNQSYAELISKEKKEALSQTLHQSEIFSPQSFVTLFPLVTVRVDVDFASEIFFLSHPDTLSSHLTDAELSHGIAASSFPPLQDWDGISHSPASWLGVRAPSSESASKMRRTLLGCLALATSSDYRHLFSGRPTFGGFCELNTSYRLSVGESHTPALMEDIVIAANDAGWLDSLASKMVSNDDNSQRQLRSMEYFYRAWPLSDSERFPLLCMALDSILGKREDSTQAVIDGVHLTLGKKVNSSRVRKLLKLRASVIHGGAPDVYDSKKYGSYYNTYSDDPISDMELLVVACIRASSFGNLFREQPDPQLEFRARLEREGRITPRGEVRSILDDIED
jgi:hypothetical protein